MKTKARPDAKAAATNDRAKRANPSGKAGKAEKPTGGKPDAGAESRKAQMVKVLGEIYYPQWEKLANDIASGRIDTAPEYADLRAMPDWAAFRASFNADAAKPEAKAKAKGGKR